MAGEHAQKLREVAAQLSTERFQGWSNPLVTAITDAADFLDGSEKIDTGDAVLSSPTPVAPVSPDATGKCGELETVAWTNKAQLSFLKDDQWKVIPMAMWAKEYQAASDDDIGLCDRSQAEELLAAEQHERDMLKADFNDINAERHRWKDRAEKAEADNAAKDAQLALAETSMLEMHQDLNKLEADNAALTARVKELEKALETEKTLSRGDWACQRDVDQMSIKLEALEAKLKAAEKARDAMRKAAVDYCWQRYKGRDPMNLKDPAVFTSHEWEKIGEVMDEAARAALGGKPS
nr:MAG TPA: outer capsid protein sigma-1 attachment protein [Caudoviricetes sp.]